MGTKGMEVGPGGSSVWPEEAAAEAEAVKGGVGVLGTLGRWAGWVELWGWHGSDNPPSCLPVRSAAERILTHAGAHTAHAGGDASQTPAGQPQPAAQAQLQ